MLRLYTRSFLILCGSYFFFFASFNLIIPELPAYLSSLGGAPYIGLNIGIFALVAGLSRPFSGRLADTVGRKPVIFFGIAICGIVGLLYPLVGSVFLFLSLRFFHGLSTGFTPTGASAYVADVVPDERRGEAMGIIGLCGSLGMAAGPYIGSLIAEGYSIKYVFWLSSVMAILSGLVLLPMPESLAEPRPLRLNLLKIKLRDVYEPRVFAPALVVMLTVVSFGIVLTLVPDFSEKLGLNKGLYFLYFTLASIAVRFFAGKISDKLGRAPMLKIGALLLAGAMLLSGFATQGFQFLVGAVLFGFAAGINSPTAMAWTVDLSLPEKRGRALATMFIALEIGIVLGSTLSGWVYATNPNWLGYIFSAGAVLAIVVFLYLWRLQVHHKVQQPA